MYEIKWDQNSFQIQINILCVLSKNRNVIKVYVLQYQIFLGQVIQTLQIESESDLISSDTTLLIDMNK